MTCRPLCEYRGVRSLSNHGGRVQDPGLAPRSSTRRGADAHWLASASRSQLVLGGLCDPTRRQMVRFDILARLLPLEDLVAEHVEHDSIATASFTTERVSLDSERVGLASFKPRHNRVRTCVIARFTPGVD